MTIISEFAFLQACALPGFGYVGNMNYGGCLDSIYGLEDLFGPLYFLGPNLFGSLGAYVLLCINI